LARTPGPCDFLVLSASYGAGHNQVARAVSEALEALEPGCRAPVVDYGELVSPLMSRVTQFSYVQTVRHAPTCYGWFYAATKEIPRSSAFQRWLDGIGRDELRRLIEVCRPRAVICTYTGPAAVLSALKGCGESPVPLFTVITDHGVHSQWVHPHTDAYFVSCDEVAEDVACRVGGRRPVHVTGIPLRRPFWEPRDGAASLARLGLQPHRPTLMVMAGAFGMMGGTKQVCRVIARLAPACQAVVVTGRRPGMRRHLEAMVAGSRNPMRILDYTEDVAGLLAASRLLIGKAGGVTTAEAMSVGVPMVVFRPIPGQEADNTAHLVRRGAALAVRTPADLERSLLRLLEEPGSLESRGAGARARRPGGPGGRTGGAGLRPRRARGGHRGPGAMSSRPGGWAVWLRNRAAWGFLLAIATAEFARGALFITLLPTYLPRHGLSAVDVGLVLSGQYLADLVFKIPSGWLEDRFGPWPVLVPSLTLAAMAVFLLPHLSSPGALLADAVAFGAGLSPNWPAAMSWMPRLAPPEAKASATGLIFIAWLGGGGLGPVLITFISSSYSFHFAFRLLAVVMAVAPLVTLAGLTGLLGRVTTAVGQVHLPGRETVANLARQLHQVRRLLPGMFVQTFSLGLILPVLAPFVRFHLGLSQTQYGLVLLCGGGVAVLCLLPFGRLADSYGFRPFLVSGFWLAGAAGFLIPFLPASGVFWDAAVLGLSYAMILPSWNGLLIASVPDEQRGLFLGVFMAVEGLGLAVGPVLGGLLWSTLGTRAPFLVTSGLLLMMGFVYLARRTEHLAGLGR
jgi:processive 1,2-diacylglycerol beta-glucosyltransferase